MSSEPESTLAWWAARRLRYNIGLVVAGILAWLCYAAVCVTLLPRVLDESSIEIAGIEFFAQAIGYLVAIGIANVCYFLGPVSEAIVRPANVRRYRIVCYRLGFWFSFLLPFSIPVLLAILILFFPGHWKE